MRQLEINAPFPREEGVLGLPLGPTHPHINEAMTEDVFKYVAGEKGYYRKVLNQDEHWLPLEAVDIKVGEWEPILTGGNHIEHQMRRGHMFACRRVDGFARKLKTSAIAITEFLRDDDDRYERALASVGLWDRSKVL